MCYLEKLECSSLRDAGIKYLAKYFVGGDNTAEFQNIVGTINLNLLFILERENIGLACWEGAMPADIFLHNLHNMNVVPDGNGSTPIPNIFLHNSSVENLQLIMNYHCVLRYEYKPRNDVVVQTAHPERWRPR